MKLLGKKGISARYGHNREASAGFDGYIYGQTKEPIGSLKYGGANKELRDVGCGVAAIYNVMRYLGMPQGIAEVARDAEQLRLAFFGGRFGTKTRKLGRYFALHGVPCSKYRSCRSFKDALPSHKITIVCSWNDKITDGIHFYRLYPDPESGKIMSLNYHSSDAPQVFSADRLRDDRFIIGYGF